VNELVQLLSHLESDLLIYRDKLREETKASLHKMKALDKSTGFAERMRGVTQLAKFDAQWGIPHSYHDEWTQSSRNLLDSDMIADEDEIKRYLGTTIIMRDASFIAHSVGNAFRTAKDKKAQFTSSNVNEKIPDHEVGIEIIRLFIQDMIGVRTKEAGTFSAKFGGEFKESWAVAHELKVTAFVLIVLLDIFLVLLAIRQGSTKGPKWQAVWFKVSLAKVVFDLSFKEIFKSAIIQYVIPSLLKLDMNVIRSVLVTNGGRLLKKSPAFHLNRFSASDYMFASTMLARSFPNLVESKIVLMYRDVYPERISQMRHARNFMLKISTASDSGFRKWGRSNTLTNFFSMTLFTALLYFGSLPLHIQRCIIDIVPAGLLVFLSWLVNTVSRSSSLIILVLFFLCMTFGPRFWTSIKDTLSECIGWIANHMGINASFLTDYEVKRIQKRIHQQRMSTVHAMAQADRSIFDVATNAESSDDSLYSDELVEELSEALSENNEHHADAVVEDVESGANVGPRKTEIVRNKKSEADEHDTLRQRSMAIREQRQRKKLADRLRMRSSSNELVNASDNVGLDSRTSRDHDDDVIASHSHSLNPHRHDTMRRFGEVLRKNVERVGEIENDTETRRKAQKERLAIRLAYRQLTTLSSSSSDENVIQRGRQPTVRIGNCDEENDFVRTRRKLKKKSSKAFRAVRMPSSVEDEDSTNATLPITEYINSAHYTENSDDEGGSREIFESVLKPSEKQKKMNKHSKKKKKVRVRA